MKQALSIIVIIIAISLTIWMYASDHRDQTDISSPNTPQNEQAKSTENNSSVENNSSKVLDLSKQNLRSVPSYIFDIEELEELDLSDNELDGALPAEIRHNSNLKKLDVSGNNMTGIPAEIGQLEKLETLDYADNKITGLPLEIANLKNLQEFDLSGNDYSKTDMEKIKENLPELKIVEDSSDTSTSSAQDRKDETENTVEEMTTDTKEESLEVPENKINCEIGTFNQQFLCIINNYRSQNSKNKLSLDTGLTSVAQGHSDWMNNTGAFSHTGENNSSFSQRCTDAGITCDAENLANGASSAESLFAMWKNSPTHNSNMLGNHSSIGLASSGKYFTLIFN